MKALDGDLLHGWLSRRATAGAGCAAAATATAASTAAPWLAAAPQREPASGMTSDLRPPTDSAARCVFESSNSITQFGETTTTTGPRRNSSQLFSTPTLKPIVLL